MVSSNNCQRRLIRSWKSLMILFKCFAEIGFVDPAIGIIGISNIHSTPPPFWSLKNDQTITHLYGLCVFSLAIINKPVERGQPCYPRKKLASWICSSSRSTLSKTSTRHDQPHNPTGIKGPRDALMHATSLASSLPC